MPASAMKSVQPTSRHPPFVAGILVAGWMATSAFAQSPAGSGSDLPGRFQIDTGYFGVSVDTILRFNGGPGEDDIDLEKDLGLDQHAATFWTDATWRVGRRHQLKLSYTRLNRDQADHTLERAFEWGGQTYNAGFSATTTSGSDILGGYYRFAVFRNERFEIGPTLGIGELWLRASIRATGTVTGPGGTEVDRTLDEGARTSSITGAVGGYANIWPAQRLALRADFLYIKVSPGDTDASITDWRLGGDYYFFRHAGLGAQYKYNKYSYHRGILASQLGGEVTFKGFQVFLSFLF